jgi:hypothetical protein
MKASEKYLKEIEKIESASASVRDNDEKLEALKSQRELCELMYYRAKADDPNLETSDAFACINWLGERGTVDDIDRLMKILRNVASSDTQNITLSIYDAIKAIFERDK